VEKRLFDPFFTTKESGTGLGLSIAARNIEKHGGALQYQTQINRGTIFGIVLPRPELVILLCRAFRVFPFQQNEQRCQNPAD